MRTVLAMLKKKAEIGDVTKVPKKTFKFDEKGILNGAIDDKSNVKNTTIKPVEKKENEYLRQKYVRMYPIDKKVPSELLIQRNLTLYPKM